MSKVWLQPIHGYCQAISNKHYSVSGKLLNMISYFFSATKYRLLELPYQQHARTQIIYYSIVMSMHRKKKILLPLLPEYKKRTELSYMPSVTI